MSESKRLIKNTGIIAIGGMATKLLQFFLLPLYTFALTPAEFGAVDYINTVALFCVPLVSMLMDEALFRYLIDYTAEADRIRVATNSCVILLVGCAVMVAGGLLVNAFLSPRDLGWVIALVLSSTMLQMTAALLRGFGKTSEFALLSFLASFVTMALNVALIVWLQMGVAGMLAASVVGQSLVSLVFLIKERIWQYIDYRTLDSSLLRDLCRYSLPLIPNKVSWTIMNMLDRLIIMNTLGAGSAGVYAVAYKFPNVMDTIYGFFYQAWKESTARALSSDEDQDVFYDKVYGTLRRFMMALVLCLVSFMPLAYKLLVNETYAEGLLYVPILLLATYYSNMSGFYGGIFTAYRQTRIMGTTTVASASLCVVLCLLLIPNLGLYGASIATLIAIFAVNEYRRLKVMSFVKLSESRAEKLLTAIAIALVFLPYYLFISQGAPVLLILSMAAALVYSLVMNIALISMLSRLLREKLTRR